ncbi:hypothetical protein SXANM310S_00253 [Streptomyces xanthochromogenes]
MAPRTLPDSSMPSAARSCGAASHSATIVLVAIAAIGASGHRGIVRDHDERAAPTFRHLEQEVRHAVPRGGIERPGRLVRQQYGRFIDQSPGDRGALPLSTGELTRRYPAVRHAQFCQQALGPFVGLSRGGACQQRGQRDVLHRSQFRQQLTELEHDPHVAAAMALQGPLSQPCDVLTSHLHRPAGRTDQPQYAPEERALSAAARPCHRSGLAAPYLKVHAVQEHAIGHLIPEPTDPQHRPARRHFANSLPPHGTLSRLLLAPSHRGGEALARAPPPRASLISEDRAAAYSGCPDHYPRSQRAHSSSLSGTQLHVRRLVTRFPMLL